MYKNKKFNSNNKQFIKKNFIIGDKRFELIKQFITIEFTAQPFLPIKELSLLYNIKYSKTFYIIQLFVKYKNYTNKKIKFNVNKPRATSATRTVFRLNTNQNRSYEEFYHKI